MSGVGGNSRPSVASRPDPAKAGPAPGLISYSPATGTYYDPIFRIGEQPALFQI